MVQFHFCLFSRRQKFPLVPFKGMADDNSNVAKMADFFFGSGESNWGIEKMLIVPAFSPIFTMFSKLFFLIVFKTQICELKDKRVKNITGKGNKC